MRTEDRSAGAGERILYRDRIEALHGQAGVWDYLRYDEAGDLWIGELRVVDALRRYGSPLEIVDTTLIERRSQEWFALTREVAEAQGYTGRLRYLYAAKANMASEITHAAYRSGWDAETSAQQDLAHLQWLKRKGLLPEGLRVVCNGFKLPASCHGFPEENPAPSQSRVDLPVKGLGKLSRNAPYADAIRNMAAEGWDIMPILDVGELPAFAGPDTPPLSVGLRLKFGKVADEGALGRLESRFGFEQEALFAAAREIAALPHLELRCLHAMVGAAETIPVPRFVESLLLAGRIWMQLKAEHPSLVELNMGGGLPPLGENYDHRGFLEGLLSGLKRIAEEAGLPAPDLCFELGSLVVAECGFHIFKVMQQKRNHHEASGEAGAPWALLDGGLMAAIPDMLLIDKPFRFLAVSGANLPAIPVRFGDPSCDSDGRYPPASFGPEASEWLPDSDGPLHVCIQGVGAYQEILSGVRGAHHCGLLEAIELILERRSDGRVAGRLMPRQTSAEAAAVLGYTDDSARALRATMPR
jgi:arginine decarboxylase